MKPSLTAIALALLLPVAAPAGRCGGRIALDIAPAAFVNGPDITLGDIAAVRCEDEATAARLRSIRIASAPTVGKCRQVDPTYIRVRLRQHGFDPDAMEVQWPQAVLVTARAITVSGAALALAGEQALAAQGESESQTVITCLRTPPDLTLPEGRLELKAEPVGVCTGSARLVKVSAWVNGQPHSSRTVCYRLQRFAEVVVARAHIGRNEMIRAEHIALERREINAAGGEPIQDVQDAVGLRARRTLRPGEMLTRAALEAPSAVKRGDTVWVRVTCGAIRVSAQAVACEDAAPGTALRLKSISSGETFVAQVDAEGQIFVRL